MRWLIKGSLLSHVKILLVMVNKYLAVLKKNFSLNRWWSEWRISSSILHWENLYEKIRLVSLIILCIAIFFSIDLGINFAYSLVPELNDSIGNRCIINIFGDSGWTREAYLAAFQKSLWISFAVMIENVAIFIISIRNK